MHTDAENLLPDAKVSQLQHSIIGLFWMDE